MQKKTWKMRHVKKKEDADDLQNELRRNADRKHTKISVLQIKWKEETSSKENETEP